MVFWGSESISDILLMIGCQGHVILATVMVIFVKNASCSFFYMVYFVTQLYVIQAFLYELYIALRHLH